MIKEIQHKNQTLYPFEYEGDVYYIRFVRRGDLVQISGVFKLVILGQSINRIEPEFEYQNRDSVKVRRLMLKAKQQFLGGNK
jgi:hypothetical protein